jgi:hypothetical protein
MQANKTDTTILARFSKVARALLQKKLLKIAFQTTFQDLSRIYFFIQPYAD